MIVKSIRLRFRETGMILSLLTITLIVSIFTAGRAIAGTHNETARGKAEKSTAHASHAKPAKGVAETDNYLRAARYSIKGSERSTLVVSNAMNSTVSLRITLYNKSGQAKPVAPLDVLPLSSMYIPIADLVSGTDAERFAEGSLEISYHGRALGLATQLVVTN